VTRGTRIGIWTITTPASMRIRGKGWRRRRVCRSHYGTGGRFRVVISSREGGTTHFGRADSEAWRGFALIGSMVVEVMIPRLTANRTIQTSVSIPLPELLFNLQRKHESEFSNRCFTASNLTIQTFFFKTYIFSKHQPIDCFWTDYQ
jgi:hypothetical protein